MSRASHSALNPVARSARATETGAVLASVLASVLALVIVTSTSTATATPAQDDRRDARDDTRPTKILVLDVAGESLSKEEAGAIRDRLAAEVSKRRNVEVISSEDMRRVLDVEAQKQAAGCEGGDDCLAEIGAALGADRVLYASVARLGEAFVVNLALVDPINARSVGRDSFQAGSLADAAAQMPDAAARLFGRPRSTRDAAAKGAPVVTITGGVITGIGAVAAGGFGIATFLAYDTVQTPGASGAQKQAALNNGPGYLTAALVSGGVVAVGGLVTVIGLIVE